jgi:hypothetical protein
MSIGRCPMKRNPLKKALMLGAVVLGALLVAPSQDAEAHWRRRGWGPGYYAGYSTWRAPVYGGYYYAAPSYYYTAPVYSSYGWGGYPTYGYGGYGYGGYPAYGYGGGFYSPGFGYYRSGWRSGWGVSIGF